MTQRRVPFWRKTAPVVLPLLLLAAAPAKDWLARIEPEARRGEPRIVEIRHQIHQNPELSNREGDAALVALPRDLGWVKTGARNGVVGHSRAGGRGVVAVRADGAARTTDRHRRLESAPRTGGRRSA
jgi:hypothetical protein